MKQQPNQSAGHWGFFWLTEGLWTRQCCLRLGPVRFENRLNAVNSGRGQISGPGKTSSLHCSSWSSHALLKRFLPHCKMIWQQIGPVTQSLNAFVVHFWEVFGKPVGDSSMGEKLYHLKQGKSSMNDFDIRLCTLAATSGWNERTTPRPFGPQQDFHCRRLYN